MAMSLAGCGGAKLSVADEQMARGEYFEASKTYRKVYNKMTRKEERPMRGEVAFKMAECYRRLGMDARASAAYGNAIRYGYPDSTAQLYLAQSLHAEGKYQPAIQAYERYIELDPSSVVAATGLSGARTALTMKQTPTRYVVKQPKTLNSRRADFSPMFCGKDLDVLYFTTTNEEVTGNAAAR